MRRIGDNLGDLVARLGESDGSAGRALRRAAVHHLWETSVRCVFKDAAPLVLEHTNAVYVLSGEQGSDVRRFDRPASETRGRAVEGTVLVVYADDSMVRSELGQPPGAVEDEVQRARGERRALQDRSLHPRHEEPASVPGEGGSLSSALWPRRLACASAGKGVDGCATGSRARYGRNSGGPTGALCARKGHDGQQSIGKRRIRGKLMQGLKIAA